MRIAHTITNILVTGATGFIGSALIERLRCNEGFSVIACVRRRSEELPPTIRQIAVGDLGWDTNWRLPGSAVDVAIHAAARAHVLNDEATDPLAEFRKVNVGGTLSLARQAAAAGVRRFIFISSIGVHGNETFGRPFNPADPPNPQEHYAVSKLEAELALGECFRGTPVELVIIRAPLVYGPNAPGNFGLLMKLLDRGLPLPLGAIHNKRTLVGLDNLIDLIATCIWHPAAANQTFLAGDAEDLSTTELLRRMGIALCKPARLMPVPTWLVRAAARLLGKQEISRRLCSSLQADTSKNRDLLGWVPPVSVDEGLRAATRHLVDGSARH